MGGGIAAMTTMLLRSGEIVQRPGADVWDMGEGLGARAAGGGEGGRVGRGHPPEGATCVSFATPSCVSLELAQRCAGYVTSVTYRDDAVPRLSIASLELLKEDMKEDSEGLLAMKNLSQEEQGVLIEDVVGGGNFLMEIERVFHRLGLGSMPWGSQSRIPQANGMGVPPEALEAARQGSHAPGHRAGLSVGGQL
ncbi:unnamed protein product [Discosporangium mesarthrocarpum]